MITEPVDSQTSGMIRDFANQGMRSEADLIGDMNQGTDFKAPAQSTLPSQTKGFDNEALLGAIEQRALRGTRAEEAQNKSVMQLDAARLRLSRLSQAAAMTNAEFKLNEQARLNRYIMQQNRKRARAQTLGNILGIVGAGAGLVATGGNPAGAMAGYQIGQGAGQSTGY